MNEDRRLLTAVAQHDPRAFLTLYERWKPILMGHVVVRHPQLRHDAEDVAQEVLARVWESADRWDGSKGSAHGWLWEITHNLCLDLERRRLVRKRRAHELKTRTPDSETPTVLDDLASDEAAEHLRLRLKRLPGMSPTRRAALFAAAEEPGETNAGMAARLSTPKNTFRVRLHRARQIARHALEAS